MEENKTTQQTNSKKKIDKRYSIPSWKEGETRQTVAGCICKNKYKFKGKEYVNQCTLADDADTEGKGSWCTVEGKCGYLDTDNRLSTSKNIYYDYCYPSSSSTRIIGNRVYTEAIKGFLLFACIFIIIIPIILYKIHWYEFLEVYLPNFDLLATSIGFNMGPPGSWIFRSLYPEAPLTWIGDGSKTLINYLSLLGVSYIIARRSVKFKSIMKGWGIGFVMLLMTYLLPNNFIVMGQEKLSDYMFENYNMDIHNHWLPWLICVTLGFLISLSFIMFEKHLLVQHKYFVDPIVSIVEKIQKWLLSL